MKNIRFDEIVNVSVIDRTTHEIDADARCYNAPKHGLASHRMVWRATGRDGVQRVFADVLCRACAREYHDAIPPTTEVAARAEYDRERAAAAAADAVRCSGCNHTIGSHGGTNDDVFRPCECLTSEGRCGCTRTRGEIRHEHAQVAAYEAAR